MQFVVKIVVKNAVSFSDATGLDISPAQAVQWEMLPGIPAAEENRN